MHERRPSRKLVGMESDTPGGHECMVKLSFFLVARKSGITMFSFSHHSVCILPRTVYHTAYLANKTIPAVLRNLRQTPALRRSPPNALSFSGLSSIRMYIFGNLAAIRQLGSSRDCLGGDQSSREPIGREMFLASTGTYGMFRCMLSRTPGPVP